ncbi:unnamed protein product [Fraxinus pennsylvanica]|uniref:D-alanine--D-alanine ligase C-terminal domain-containing protein n=1 Tax=Fraxinus pennsylvanica TaxID=56036 RepID=A0AAD2DP36_9LAMI|nr:unnamed protein product [Fraxinus pennsylvanica]
MSGTNVWLNLNAIDDLNVIPCLLASTNRIHPICILTRQNQERAPGLFGHYRKWVEITVGVVGKRGSMHSLTPSITVKGTGDILSLEEKFHGGTGINLTPPPLSLIRSMNLIRLVKLLLMSDLVKIKKDPYKAIMKMMILNVMCLLEGFSRIDAFVKVDNGEALIIEVNTVPGMTPFTVLIHQALEEKPPCILNCSVVHCLSWPQRVNGNFGFYGFSCVLLIMALLAPEEPFFFEVVRFLGLTTNCLVIEMGHGWYVWRPWVPHTKCRGLGQSSTHMVGKLAISTHMGYNENYDIVIRACLVVPATHRAYGNPMEPMKMVGSLGP